jgi:hypothetical protein
MMKLLRRALVLVLVVAGVLLLAGCPGFLSPSLEGTWEQIGELILPSGPDTFGAFTNTTAVFGSGTYSFSYTMVDPYPDGDATTASHSGTISPAEPEEGDDLTFTVTEAEGEFAPEVESTFAGELIYLRRDTMVMKIQTGAELLVAWTFERTD